MNKQFLIKLIEDYCKENNLEVNDIYNKIAELYQDKEYGINPNVEKDDYCKKNGLDYISMTNWLQELNIVDRYITIFNKMVRGEYDA
jgi:hypothetical protein